MGKVTLKEIAEAVGVSRMTVSNAFSQPQRLSAALRTRILATAEEMGYAGPDPSARALARGRSGTVGLLITDSLGEAFRDPVATEFLVAVGDALGENGLALTLVTAGHGETVLARDVSMDGAIVYVCDRDSVDLAWLRKRGMPLVTVDQAAIEGIPAINVDDRSGARAAAQHLLDLGHRRIGLLNLAPVGRVENPPATQRDLGWRDALTSAGVDLVEARAAFRPPEAAHDAALGLLDSPDRPTALLCFSDVFAGQALRAAAALGLRVPEDLSVVGYDDSPLASTLSPALTTVRQQFDRKGRLAVEALLGALAGAEVPDEAPRTVLGTELVVRGSTGPAPAGPAG